ncbi:IS66 family insertion sequence element accessory protein TnpB [Lactiplantibacillus plantarum]|jgi:transposase|uniref:IS66 family insertion sequence element accessory protein TnpB n=1 Tax=Lactiplantibacillus plantarum TaxID=1590 RepID=UPI002044ADF5|nr:IS66 family insertion sequence element accessory protein TnpB [Lactiplantibacillus plantarum]MCM2629796.1 IS66 family insertion sequence element accessory protein TnpB [Lactiplantibacillus plantarum]MCS6155495.1 IS66 family insertion sequence element accessory protein TnpB [Lactiplantibacillus plantarum]
MLIDVRKLNGIYLVCGKTDLRRGIDGLARVVTEQYELDPYDKSLFMFCGTRKDRYKALYWDGDGFLLLYKRIDNGRLQWPTNQNEVKKLHTKQLTRLLSGWALESSIHQITPPKNSRQHG